MGKGVIRKCANRRLCETSGSRYVNLEDIAALIRNGTEAEVIDAKTGQDLTRVTLTQSGPRGLRQINRFSGGPGCRWRSPLPSCPFRCLGSVRALRGSTGAWPESSDIELKFKADSREGVAM